MTINCPTDADMAAALAALRPRGDAWRNGGGDELAGSVMGRFFNALGVAYGAAHRRICDLVNELFCSTANETIDAWQRDYGLPDACNPLANVCDKVNFVGDTTRASVIAEALQAGWVITIAEEFIFAAEDSLFGAGSFGPVIFGAEQGVLWAVTVDIAASPAMNDPQYQPPLFGLQLFGDAFACAPDVWPLECLIRRIAPAHADLTFTTI